ncbi:hypothetical protein EV191_112119 [Tamaricihabitans halophyticus]|uniref:Uncharacterized protein n=1 Tax=Tamaricihabitans halophyticus TaxID=1262583 RepID=A0A4R2QE11_9PSEU|nr:hypothetical protein [Tamaricihabitans halophyticus]TCP47323.1 hypothetical protein EV191_112119 [Tamaricihabitans halophyticus]
MRSSCYPLARRQAFVLLAAIGTAAIAFLPVVGAVQLAGVSLTAWILVILMIVVPVATILVTGNEVD